LNYHKLIEIQTALWHTRFFAVFTVNMWHLEYILTPIKQKKITMLRN